MPGIRATFTLDALGFEQALRTYLLTIRDGPVKAELVKNQMRFAVRAIIDLTPFETLAQGRAVVKRDLTAAMKPYGVDGGAFPISEIRNAGLRGRLRAYMRSGDFGKVKAIWEKLGAGTDYVMRDFSVEQHHNNMDARGRPYGDRRVLVPQVQEWRKYLDHLRGQVGRARGGWAASAAAFGLSLPEWVTRWKAGGSISSVITERNVRFVLINRAVFIPSARYKATINLALTGREKAMATDVRRWLAGQASHAGLTRS